MWRDFYNPNLDTDSAEAIYEAENNRSFLQARLTSEEEEASARTMTLVPFFVRGLL